MASFGQTLAGNHVVDDLLVSVANVQGLHRKYHQLQTQLKARKGRAYPQMDQKDLSNRLMQDKGHTQHLRALSEMTSKHSREMEAMSTAVRAELEQSAQGPASRVQETTERNRRAAFVYLDKTHFYQTTDETEGLKHFSPAPLVVAGRLEASDALPLAEIQRVMGDSRTSWTPDRIFREARKYYDQLALEKKNTSISNLLHSQLNQSNQFLSERDASLRDVTTSRDQLSDKVTSLTNQMDCMVPQATHEGALDKQTREHQDRLKERERQLTADHSRSVQEVRKLAREAAEAEANAHGKALAALQTQLEQRKAELTGKEAVVKDIQDKYEALKGDLTVAQGAAATGDEEKNIAIEKLQHQLKQQNLSLEESRELNKRLRAEQQGVVDESDRRQTSNVELKARVGALESSLTQANEGHHAEKTRLEMEVSDLKKKLQDTSIDAKRLLDVETREIPELQKKLQNLQISRDSAESQSKQLSVQLTNSSAEVERLSTELGQFKAQVDGLSASDQRNQGELAEADRKMEELDSSLKRARKDQKQEQKANQTKIGAIQKESNDLQFALKASFPGSAHRFSDEIAVQNIMAGVCDPQPTIRPAEENLACLRWDLATASAAAIQSYAHDESLPRRLWLQTCYSDDHQEVMVLTEAIIYSLYHNQTYPHASMKFLLAATRMLVRHITAAAQQSIPVTNLAIAAFRVMELSLRLGLAAEELRDLYQQTVAPFDGIAAVGNPLLYGLAEWVHRTIEQPDHRDTLPAIIGHSTEFDRIIHRSTNCLGLFGGLTGILLVDVQRDRITEIAAQDVTWECVMTPPNMFDVFTFSCERRDAGDFAVTPERFEARTCKATQMFLSRYLPGAVRGALDGLHV